MNKFLLPRTLGFSLLFSLSVYSAAAQAVTNDKKPADVNQADNAAVVQPAQAANVGKEIPVPGAVLYVPAAEAASMEKQKAAKSKRSKKMRREDRREVTRVIGQSVDTYLANVYNVHTLQRF